MRITPKDIYHLGKLSKIELKEEEIKKLSSQIEQILSFVNQISQLKEENCKPQTHATGIKNVFREDEVKPSLSQQQALSNAKETHQGYFKIEAIFSENET